MAAPANYTPLASAASTEPGAVDDLATLNNLNEDTLLSELDVRYGQDKIYTYVSDILVAVNPFKQLPIYTPENEALYKNKKHSELPPHVYAIADACYHNLFDMKQNQCAIISGESGAGKTESAKFIIKHIIELCKAGSYGTNLEEQIIQISPLLEAFGNAQTNMNHNSSRFGKYTRMLFDSKGSVMGVQLSEYLLEKSRVVAQGEGERNFHVFYYMFANPSKDELGLSSPDAFRCLSGALPADNDAQFTELVGAMDVVGFDAENQRMLFTTLAACAHLSNIEFGAEGDEGTATLPSMEAVEQVAALLQVDAAKLAEVFLGANTVTRGEHIRRKFKQAQAGDVRDALAKVLYSSMFGWIVNKVNRLLGHELHQKKASTGRYGKAVIAKPAYEIGVLDIFGFENFDVNSFEQLCINVAHEQLQFFFNKHTFKLELEEYDHEGVDVAKVTFKDNEDLLRMFLDRPVGVFSLLDEECSFPQSTDDTLLQKFERHFADKERFIKINSPAGKPSFAIDHFPGKVTYSAIEFLDKNRDNLAGDVTTVMRESEVKIISEIFWGEVLSTGQIRPGKKPDAKRLHRGKEVAQDTNKNVVHRKTPTLSAQFKNSLAVLIDRMTSCYPHFVRCIKPNQSQQPDQFVGDFVRTQLLYTGVLEATRIRKEGFSWRPTFHEFVARYKQLAFPITKLTQVKSNASTAERVAKAAGISDFLIGTTKVFLRWFHASQMENALEQFYQRIIIAQSAVRAKIARRRLAVLKERAKMDAAERAKAEAAEAAERAAREQKRLERLAVEEAKQRAEQERELAEQRRVEELKAAEEESRKAAEADQLRKEAEDAAAEEATLTEEARQAKQLAEEDALEALRRAEEAADVKAIALRAQEETAARLSEIQELAEEARQAAEAAEKEKFKQKKERVKSMKKRKADVEKAARETREKAIAEALAAEQRELARQEAAEAARTAEQARRDQEKKAAADTEAAIMEKLKQMEAEAAAARERARIEAQAAAEAQAAKAEADRIASEAELAKQQELARLAEERAMIEAERVAGDYTRADFNLGTRVWDQLLGGKVQCDGVAIEQRKASGWMHKVGLFRKTWRKRWFIFDLDTMSLSYFENQKAKRPKNRTDLQQILRAFAPPPDEKSSHHKEAHLLILETVHRTFYLQAPSAEALQVWIEILNVVVERESNLAALAGDSSASLK